MKDIEILRHRLTGVSFAVVLLIALLLPSCALSKEKGKEKEKARQDSPIMKVAFDYYPPGESDIKFLSHFDLIVLGDYVDADMAEKLKANGAKLAIYKWLPAFYYCKGNTDAWKELVFRNRASWTLNPRTSDPHPMGEKWGCFDFYYDMANKRLARARAGHIVSEARSHGFDGVFLDWGSGLYDIEERKYDFIKKAFIKRHPRAGYDAAAADFLKKLRNGGLTIILNRGFKSPEAMLDRYADVDVVESMFTSNVRLASRAAGRSHTAPGEKKKPGGQETWFNAAGSAVKLASEITRAARAANPAIKFVFLNYALPAGRQSPNGRKTTDRRAVFYSLALGYLEGEWGFTSGPEVSLKDVKEGVYFYNIGTPLGTVVKAGRTTYTRGYSGGAVVVSGDGSAVRLRTPAGVKKVYDIFSGKHLAVSDGEVNVNWGPSAAFPAGRIFLYEH